jgi:hypothetical protein
VLEAETNWYRKRKWKPAPKISQAQLLNNQLPDRESDEDYSRGGYFNIGKAFRNPSFYRILANPIGLPLRLVGPAAFVLFKDWLVLPKKQYFAYIGEYAAHLLGIKRSKGPSESQSLRIMMKDRTPEPKTKSQESMLPFREGR